MHPQMEAIAVEFEHAQDRPHRLAPWMSHELWANRPCPQGRSVSKCVAHVNLTTRAFLPVLRTGLTQALLGPGAVAPRT